jgi:hypothetical protein
MQYHLSSREDEMTEEIAELRQKEIFQILVGLQDQGLDVRQSRARVAEQESISIDQIREIEREGLIHNWPPLE